MATDRTERLLNLVICLLGASRPVSRASLRDSIPGYGEAATTEAFERMFERDKDELRQMGIPIDTVINHQGEVEGYRIDQASYAMPPLSLDPAEIAVLGLAAHMWNEAAIAAEAGAALRKIEARTGQRWSAPTLVQTRPGTGEEALPALWEAIRLRQPVRFAYLARGRDEAEERTVEPWATVHREGAWYLVGHSRERGEARAFRLSRVEGRMSVLRETFTPADRHLIEQVVASISDPAPRATATVLLPDTGAARIREQARPTENGGSMTGAWEIDFADAHVLVSEVIESGAQIVAPATLVEAQRQALLRVAETHDG
jgi:predicted DNA-binding transcriptional regulator YafY